MDQPELAPGLAQPRRQPQVGLHGSRLDEDTGVQEVVGVEEVLDGGEQAERLGRVHPRQQCRPGSPVAVLAGHAAAVPGSQGGGRLDESPEPPGAVPLAQREVDAHVHAAVTEVAVGHAVEAGLPQQRVEAAQVVPQPVGGHGGVLPAALRRPVEAARGEPGAVLPDPPERSGLGSIRHDAHVDRAGVAGHCRRGTLRLLDGATGDLGEQPAPAARQLRHRGAGSTHHVDDAGVEALAGNEGVPKQTGHRVGGLEHVRVAEHREGAGRRVLDEPHGRRGDDGERALAADQEAGDVAAVLRQQLLEGVAGHLTREAAELGAHGRQPRVHEGVETVEQRGRGPLVSEPQPLPRRGHHVEAHDVVAGAAVAEGSRPARVVADHASDGAAGVRRRVGTEPQPVPARRSLQRRVHGARLHDGEMCLRVDVHDAVQVA